MAAERGSVAICRHPCCWCVDSLVRCRSRPCADCHSCTHEEGSSTPLPAPCCKDDIMPELLRRYAAHIVRHPWRVLILSLLGTAAVAAGMSRLTINLDLEQQLPADHPYVVVDRTVRKEFGGRNFVV